MLCLLLVGVSTDSRAAGCVPERCCAGMLGTRRRLRAASFDREPGGLAAGLWVGPVGQVHEGFSCQAWADDADGAVAWALALARLHYVVHGEC